MVKFDFATWADRWLIETNTVDDFQVVFFSYPRFDVRNIFFYSGSLELWLFSDGKVVPVFGRHL